MSDTDRSELSPDTPLEGFTVGRMVHYVLRAGPCRGEARAAVIVRKWDAHTGVANLVVTLDGSNDGETEFLATETRLHALARSIPYDRTGSPGTWHWPTVLR